MFVKHLEVTNSRLGVVEPLRERNLAGPRDSLQAASIARDRSMDRFAIFVDKVTRRRRAAASVVGLSHRPTDRNRVRAFISSNATAC